MNYSIQWSLLNATLEKTHHKDTPLKTQFLVKVP